MKTAYDPSRRTFLRGTGGAGLLLLSACDSGTPGQAGNGRFRHGVASGDPLADRVVLWTRVSDALGPREVFWEVAEDEGFAQVVRRGSVQARPQADWTVKVDADGLLPGSTYYYRFMTGSDVSPTGRTRTLPVGGVDRLRIAATSCSSYRKAFFTGYRKLAQRHDLDLVIHLGDYIYEDGNAAQVGDRDHFPPVVLTALEEYRARYAQYRSDPELQECHRQHPWTFAWDDHEFANDCWATGARAHDDERDGSWELRKQAAARAYHEWLPIRTADPDDLTRIWRSFTFGDLLTLAMIETRVHGRDSLVPGLVDDGEFVNGRPGQFNSPQRTMMGFEQEDWLYATMHGAATQYFMLGSQTFFAQLNILNLPQFAGGGVIANPDQWDGYYANRTRILQQVVEAGIRNFVVVSGDIHTSWANDLSLDPGNPLVYDPILRRGVIGCEFVSSAIGNPGEEELAPVADVVRLLNSHIRYVNLHRDGYVLVDIDRDRVRGEFWHIDTVREAGTGSEYVDIAFEARDGSNVLRRADDTPAPPHPDRPPPAA